MELRYWRVAVGLFGVWVGVAAWAAGARAVQDDDLRALEGDWLYVEDRTEGRAVEDQGPPMSVTFGLRIDEEAFVFVRGKGERRREEAVALDGSVTEVEGGTSRTLRRGEWKDGTFVYEADVVRVADGSRVTLIRREFRKSPDGLLVRVLVGDPATMDSVALYRHPQDIELPTPARAVIADMAWVADGWVGTRNTSTIEERWTPPLGGAMLGVSRTVKGDRMVAFEYLRIIERDGGLVYVAQPGGRPPTEFVLTELGEARAVFENPRHDSPQRIVYERTGEDTLVASIGFIHGGRPQRFEFTRDED